MNGILTETEKQSPDQLQLCFCYMMDLLGILTEKMPRTYFHQTPGVLEGLNTRKQYMLTKPQKRQSVVFWGFVIFATKSDVKSDFLSFFTIGKQKASAGRTAQVMLKYYRSLRKA